MVFGQGVIYCLASIKAHPLWRTMRVFWVPWCPCCSDSQKFWLFLFPQCKVSGRTGMDKMRVPVARILTWLWLTASLHTCGQYMAVDSIKRAPPSALGMTWWQGCKAAGEQRPRGWLCGMAVQRSPKDGCVDRGAQRQRQACCIQMHSE